MKYLLTGPVSRINRFGNWIEQVITLIFTGLAVSIVFNANQFSMGAEGQIFVGALAAALVGLSLPALPGILHIPLALLAAAGSGFAWGAIPGYLKARFRANEVVSSLMLNSIAIQLYDYVLIYHLKPPTAGYPVSKYLPSSAPPLLGVNPTEKMSPLWLCSAGDPRIMLRLAAESRIGLRPALLLDSASAPD